MLVFFNRFLFAASVIFTIYGLYFALIGVRGLTRKTPSIPSAKPQKRIACVVAARNEAAVIGPLVESLLAQDYPRELFEVIVAPNNCTDNTEAIAKNAGARIFHPKGVIRSKGEVLTQVVDEIILKENFDGMCVFDADNLAGRGFLARMNDALCAGIHAAQGFRDSKNPEQTAISGCYSICYWMLNRFYNSARASMGLSALVNGSGFVVSRELLEDLDGWHTVTMTEDYEFSAQCALRGHRVHFIPDAVIYDEQPLTFAQSWRQRRRWTTGSLQGLQEYGFSLFRQAIVKKSWICFDMYLTFLMPFVQLLGVILGALSAAPILISGGIVLGDIVVKGIVALVTLMGGMFIASIIATIFMAALTVVLKKGNVNGMERGIASFWLFAFSHMVLTLLSFFHKETNWKPIAHTSVKRLGDVE